MSYVRVITCLLASQLFLPVNPAQAPTGVPVMAIPREDSSVKFAVKASVPIAGTFDKWDATLTYPSTDVEAGVLDIKVEAASVNASQPDSARRVRKPASLLLTSIITRI